MLAVSSGTSRCEVSFQFPLHHFHNADVLEPNCFPHSECANNWPPVRAGFPPFSLRFGTSEIISHFQVVWKHSVTALFDQRGTSLLNN